MEPGIMLHFHYDRIMLYLLFKSKFKIKKSFF